MAELFGDGSISEETDEESDDDSSNEDMDSDDGSEDGSDDGSEESEMLMSSDEEDRLDRLLLGDGLESLEDDEDVDYIPSQETNMSSCDSQVSSASEDPLARPEMEWKDQSCIDTGAPDPRTIQFRPKRNPGIQLDYFRRSSRANYTKPVNFFRLFFTTELLQIICDATNICAEMNHFKGRNKSYFTAPGKTWLPVTISEMLSFIGILIFMSFVKLPTLARYWSKKSLYKGIIVPDIMTKLRFKAILSFLQVVPQENINRDNKLSKVQHLLDFIKTKSQQFFHPYRSICVDERMLPSKHKSGLKQFMRDKPVRFGFKLWVIACSSTGYTFDFNVYLGKSGAPLQRPENGLAYNVVFELIHHFFHQGYHLYVDNFFTTQKLVLDLLTNGVYLIGTVKVNSSAMPLIFKDRDMWGKCCRRGDYRWIREGPYSVVQWKDSTVVTVLSTVHPGHSISACKRKMKSRNKWRSKQILQPAAVADYNKGMVGVDQSDQNLSKYPTHLKTLLNWWKLFFYHSIDIAVVNAFILYKEYANQFNLNMLSPFGQIEFRESLVESLCDLDSKIDSKATTNCKPDVNDQRRQCKMCHAEARINGVKPPKNKTQFLCRQCEAPLCITKERNCFVRWHSPEGKQFRDWVTQSGRRK